MRLSYAKERERIGRDQTIYGRKTIPLLQVKAATTITTIRADTIFKSFMGRRYR
jgi:hypothetical protein